MFPWPDYKRAYTTGIFCDYIHKELWFALTLFTCLAKISSWCSWTGRLSVLILTRWLPGKISRKFFTSFTSCYFPEVKLKTAVHRSSPWGRWCACNVAPPHQLQASSCCYLGELLEVKKKKKTAGLSNQVFCNGRLFFKHYVKLNQQIWGTLLYISTQCLAGEYRLSDMDFYFVRGRICQMK